MTEKITFEEFKKRCSDFFKATDNRLALNQKEIENGQKMIALSFLRLSRDTDENDRYQASILLELATRREMECAMARVCN